MPRVRRLGAFRPLGGGSDFTSPNRNVEASYDLADYRREHVTSCVYFIACGDWVKIGTTTQGAARRFHGLQLPPNAELVAVVHNAGAVVERRLHEMFAAYRVRGEWFERCPELDALIRVHAL